MSNRTTRFVILALIIVGAAIAASALYKQKFARAAEVPGFLRSRTLRDFKLAERSQENATEQLVFTNRQSVLKIDIVHDIDVQTADALEKDGVMGLGALYGNALSPYPGDISNKTVTDARYRPQLFREVSLGRTNAYFLLFANARLGYGAMTAKEVEYTSLVGWKYCAKGRTLYKVRYFVPLRSDTEELHRLFKSFECPSAAEAAGKSQYQ